MIFVKSNQLEAQKISQAAQPTHYIFALDDSGSMSGKPWQDLMFALSEAIKTIKNIP